MGAKPDSAAPGKSSRRRRLILGLAVLAAIPAMLWLAATLWPLPPQLAAPRRVISLCIEDRNGRMLREVQSSAEGVGSWAALADIAPALPLATIAAEDRRFHQHLGVDPLALARAAWSNLRNRRVVSGASTLTMQLVRNLHPHPTRNLTSKISEAWYALCLERRFSKPQILEFYLNRIYYGNQTFGAEAAAQAYFGRPASQLSLAQAAFLAVIPRAPADNDPYRDFARVKALQEDLLDKMAGQGIITADSARMARNEPLVLTHRPPQFLAPHFCQFVQERLESRGLLLEGRTPGIRPGVIRTTLDLEIQQAVEGLVSSHVRRLADRGVGNAAVLVMDTDGGEILAMVGSIDFFDRSAGQVNGTLALRQPGSTLKPFTYALALERAKTAASLVADIDIYPQADSSSFIPANYDWTFHGPVRLRTALACSYNVAAVRTLQEIGVERLLERLRDCTFNHLSRPAKFYGLGLTLGDGEVSLLELARAYRILARGGRSGQERALLAIEGHRVEDDPGEKLTLQPVIDPRAAFIITDILADADARVPAFGAHSPLSLPFPCAAKTGTSKSYRDNWTVGYSPDYVVAVWVGNFDARPMMNVSGITGAGPLFRDIFLYLDQRDRHPNHPFREPSGIRHHAICPSSGQKPGPHCPHRMEEIFIAGNEPDRTCSVHRLVPIDRRSGLRAGPQCPAEQVEERIYEVYPPLYHSWMVKAGLPMPPDAAAAQSPAGVLATTSGWSASVDPGAARSADPERAAPTRRRDPPSVFPPAAVPAAAKPLGPTIVRDDPVMVVFPESGAEFKIDPLLRRRYQTVLFQALVPEDSRKVGWLLDGKALAPQPGETELAATDPGRNRLGIRWPLAAGAHQVQVWASNRAGRVIYSRPVDFTVR